MRKSLFVFILLLILASCRSALVLSEVQSENISNDPTDFIPDSTIISLVEPYKQELESDMSRVISYSAEAMYKQKPESNLTNFLSDILLKQGVAYCKQQGYSFQPQVAYVNYGGIRSSIPEGDVTVGNIYELMPFDNKLVILEISGKDLMAFADHVAKRGGDGVAGLQIGIKDEKASIVELDGKKLVSERSYYFATNDYVASGGDGLEMLENRKKYIDTEIIIRDLLISTIEENFKRGIKVSASKDGRIYYEE
jgi:2',3'-cyclic-nucleotide 2'-phosphodiesterase (5'-nucleotidase family)